MAQECLTKTPRNHQLVDIKPRTLHQTDQNLWIVISKSEFMSNSANITWTMRLKRYTWLTAVSILMLVKILSLAAKIPNLTEVTLTSVKPTGLSPL